MAMTKIKMTKIKKQPKPGSTYPIGYCRAPKEGKFPPGKSGNAKGRPKGAKSLKTIYREAFEKKLSVKIDGKIKTMTPKEVAMHQQAKKAMAGDPKAMALMMHFEQQYAPPDETVTSEDVAMDLTVIENLLALHATLAEESNDDA
jgi:hypothetical protein